MRFQWTVTFISTFVSMGLLVIIVGQHQMLATLNRGIEKQHSNADELDKQHVDKTFFKSTVEKLVAQGMKTTVELEATVAKLIPEMETKKTESDTCDTEKVNSCSAFCCCFRWRIVSIISRRVEVMLH
ncbi:uncharacterized protein V6R79_014002 [Siganus canaliculatus]